MANILLNLPLIVSLSITVATAKDYYVAQNGIDANDGSENKPCDPSSKPPVPPRLETPFMNANYGALEFLDGTTDFEIKNNIFSIRGNKSFIVMDRTSKPGALIDAN